MTMKQQISKNKAQETVWRFIREFRDKAVKEFGKKIDFIIIYGSAVRGEFVPGKSDVDIVFQVFKKKDKDIVEKRAIELFWKTAKKYPLLGFEESLSVSKKKKRNGFGKILEKIEQSIFLYVPVFVFVKGEINWKKGELRSKNPLVQAGQKLLIPQRSVFLRFKQEGEILYGRDIRKEIRVRLSIVDRLRLGTAPQALSFIGLSISFIASKKARNYAVKALLYHNDSLLTAIAEYKKMDKERKIAESKRLLLEEFTSELEKILRFRLDYTKGILRPSDFKLFLEAMEIKWGERKFGYFSTIYFCLKANWFILRSNLRAIGILLIKFIYGKKA